MDFVCLNGVVTGVGKHCWVKAIGLGVNAG